MFEVRIRIKEYSIDYTATAAIATAAAIATTGTLAATAGFGT
jgi:hypothetical protein